MNAYFTGGCACGAIRYEARSQPVFQNHCHCRDCQRASGTGYGSYLTFAGRDTVSISGEAREWGIIADSGNEKRHAFCPTCGTPVYLTFAAMPDIIAIHAASLDDPGRFDPRVVTYRARAHAWSVIDPSLAAFERMPSG